MASTATTAASSAATATTTAATTGAGLAMHDFLEGVGSDDGGGSDRG